MGRQKRTRTHATSRKPSRPTTSTAIVPVGRIERSIFLVRGEKVILDADLAMLYGVPTKRLNEQVRRNRDRFPDDFMFRLSWAETRVSVSHLATLSREETGQGSRSQFATLRRGWNIKYRPYAFTEHGAIMAATVLNSPRAVQVSVYVVRAFLRLRQMLGQHKELSVKLADLERKVGEHDQNIVALIQAIRRLMAPPPEAPRKRIGFRAGPWGYRPLRNSMPHRRFRGRLAAHRASKIQ